MLFLRNYESSYETLTNIGAAIFVYIMLTDVFSNSFSNFIGCSFMWYILLV